MRARESKGQVNKVPGFLVHHMWSKASNWKNDRSCVLPLEGRVRACVRMQLNTRMPSRLVG